MDLIVNVQFAAMKSDVWLEIDPLTGSKAHTISSDGITSSICPAAETHEGNIFIARTGQFTAYN